MRGYGLCCSCRRDVDATATMPRKKDEMSRTDLDEDDDLCDNVCPYCGEEGVAEGAYCHMVDDETRARIDREKAQATPR